MKAGWEVKALGEVCSKIQDGAHESPKSTYPEPASGRFPYLTSKNIRNGYLDLSDISYVDESFHNSIYPRCNAELGDVLLTKDGSNTGNVTLNTLDEPFSTLSSVCLLKPDRRVLSAAFLTYYLRSSEGFEQITGQMTGAAIKRIILKTIKASTIPLPPLDEQKRIVAVLDAAFEGLSRARAHTESNLQNARELFESQRKSLLENAGENWKVLTLDQACKVERGSSPRPIKEFFTEAEDGVNWIKIGDTDVGAKFVTSTREKITKEGALRSRRVEIGDFILTNSMTFGRPYIMAIDGYIHDGWFVLRLNDGIQRDFFYHLLSSAVVQEQFQSLAAGAVVKNISGDLVKKAVLHLPPHQEQIAIAQQLDEAAQISDQLQSHYRAKLVDLDALRQALLQKAFAGELT